MPQPPKRWIIYSAVLGLALAGVWGVRQPGERSPAPRVPPAIVAAPAAGQVPEVELERLAQRARVDTTTDLFSPRGWEALEPEAGRRKAPPPSPPLAQAPSLPFAYMGKLIDAGTTIVFLTHGDRNYSVRLGDMIDGTYRVEEVGERSMTITYLPLDLKQSLSTGSPTLAVAGAIQVSAATSEAPAAAPVPLDQPARLVWVAPSQVAIGEEFTVEVGLPAGAEPRSGRVELVYDARALALLGGAAVGSAKPSDSASARRVSVDVIGPGFLGALPTPSEVRFRVLTADPTSTKIGIEYLTAVAGGRPLAISSPAHHELAIVQGQGSRNKSN